MERRDINPWEWSKGFGFSQAIEITGPSRVLRCSGQTAIGDDGSPPTTEDMAEQLKLALDHLETVLAAADMGLANVVHLTVYTTDVDAYIEAQMADNRLANAGVLPAMTLMALPGSRTRNSRSKWKPPQSHSTWVRKASQEFRVLLLVTPSERDARVYPAC